MTQSARGHKRSVLHLHALLLAACSLSVNHLSNAQQSSAGSSSKRASPASGYGANEDAAIKALVMAKVDWENVTRVINQLFGTNRSRQAVYRHWLRNLKGGMPPGWGA
ncbi:uncharacterized protein EV422DRAFT_363026 [Fimicolochytrium jonesii]|uniref:uncharacterized protein n=1 Tax=Fimicolochytrium jonesii TaxID=1396493 RepID=UPI0022FEE487|nr:uncharacterized protein EV422DRAFT_363026 [Fimicolochytrium jonesii]KAI8823635.1 hypothetical protein EV422DRAFT_363026 [Fimicolochytrium jonesii]